VTLVVSDLIVSYGGTPVLEQACFTAPRGSLTALIGPNGSGKSTLLKAVAGLLPAAGSVRVDETDLERTRRRAEFSYMPQDTGAMVSLTILEVVLLGRLRALGWAIPAAEVSRAADLLGRLGLADLAHHTIDRVSGGQRQLAFLAQALFREPSVLLLDEPTAALDLRRQLTVLEAVRADAAARNVPAIAAMHDLTLAGHFADHIICLGSRRIDVEGAPGHVLTRDRMRRVYEIDADVEVSPAGGVRVSPLRAL